MEASGAATARAVPPVSPRAMLARLVLDAIRSLPGVVRGHPGEQRVWVTPHPSGPLDGVVAVARPDGRYDVELHLVARPMPLHPLADEVRARVAEAAAAAGSDHLLGALDIGFEDIEDEPLTVVHPPSPGLAAR